MAAGTDIAHPGSAIEGGYKPHPLEPLPLCTIKENGVALDNIESAPPPEHHDQQQQQQQQHHPQQQHPGTQAPPSRPPRPTTNSAADRPASAMRRAVSSSVIPSTPGLLDGDRENADPPLIEGVDMSFGGYMPEVRSGGWMDIGRRESMEDYHLRIDDLVEHAGSLLLSSEGPGAFYGVFDGHGGKESASFVREHLLANILEDVAFPKSMGDALRNAFLQTDQALVDGAYYSSGTTALTAMVFGRTLLVANAGDCRAVLSKRGNAVNMSRDHKAGCSEERSRIEAAGGYVYDGYLNGQLNVARALGDWGIVGLKKVGVVGPLSAEPEVQQAILTEEDEFLIIGCDGLWDVFSSQNAVDFARRKLQEHNDPERCSRELIEQALERDTTDNLTVVTVCFSPNPPPKRAFSPTSMSKPTGWVPRFRRSLSAEGLRNVQDLLDSHGGP